MATSEQAPSETQGADLLQDTVDQFEKVVDLERTLLRKSIRKLQNDLEEISTELGMKEEELFVWEQRFQQVQKDNDVKFALARARHDKEKFRTHSRGRSAGAGSSARSLGFVAEVHEAPTIMEGDEEEEDEEEDDIPRTDFAAEVTPTITPTLTPVLLEKLPCDAPAPDELTHPIIGHVNALADLLTGELEALQDQWQLVTAEITTNSHELAATQIKSSSAKVSSSTPLFNDALRSKLTVEQRIDRLQRDIRNETDRILLERGSPTMRNTSATPTSAMSATTVGFGNLSSPSPCQGSFAAPMGATSKGVPSHAGLHTPQSMTSRMNSPSYTTDTSRGLSFSLTLPHPHHSALGEVSQDAPTGNTSSSSAPIVTVKPSGGSISVGKMGSMGVARCISPSAPHLTQAYSMRALPEEQQTRTRAQYLPSTRALSSMSPTPSARTADTLQASIQGVGSSGGPPRRTMAPGSPQPNQPTPAQTPTPPQSVTAAFGHVQGRRASLTVPRH